MNRKSSEKRGLVKRTQITTYIRNDLRYTLLKYSDEYKIKMSEIYDEALELFFDKYDYPVKNPKGRPRKIRKLK